MIMGEQQAISLLEEMRPFIPVEYIVSVGCPEDKSFYWVAVSVIDTRMTERYPNEDGSPWKGICVFTVSDYEQWNAMKDFISAVTADKQEVK